MMALPASVVIVSRHRAEALWRCLKALAQQDHPKFEVIVVADPTGIASAQATGLNLKLIPFDEANISAARNLGLAEAAGEIVAFIDDDAVAEPTWLSRLCAPFADPQVIAATGFIRGRNGISFQWKACEVDALGLDHPLPDEMGLYAGTRQRAVKTQGTNCAFRRTGLSAIGGFDPAYRFYLDEADVNLRLADHGLTAVVPLAQVHHGFAASERRTENRVPTSLHEIAASIAVFLRRHAPEALTRDTIPAIEAQTRRVQRLSAEGRISETEATALHQSLAAGWDEGLARALGHLSPLPDTRKAFHPLEGTGPRQGCLIAGRLWEKPKLKRLAVEALGAGRIVTVVCLEPTPRAHRMEFTPEGFWLQSGGLFGWCERTGRRLRLSSFRRRVAEARERLTSVRPTD